MSRLKVGEVYKVNHLHELLLNAGVGQNYTLEITGVIENSFNCKVFHSDGKDITDLMSRGGKDWSVSIFEELIDSNTVCLIGSKTVKPSYQSSPRNNDGRDRCFACGAKTRTYGAVAGLPPLGHVCTECGL